METTTLKAWKETLTDVYLALILIAIVLGRLRRLPELSRRTST